MNKKIICLFMSLVLVMTFAMGVQAADDSVEYRQLSDDEVGLEIIKDTVLDLNGHTVTNATVAEGVTLQLIDSANNGYDAAACGSFSGTVNGTVEQVVNYNDKSYLVIQEDGKYSAHRFCAEITHVSLVPERVALGYKAEFQADDKINKMVAGYGYAMWLNDYAPVVRIRESVIDKNVLTLRLQNILGENDAALNELGSKATIGGKAIIRFNVNGEELTVEGADRQITLQQTVEAVNSALGANRNAYSKAQIQSVRNLCTKYVDYMTEWEQEYIFTEDKFAAVENVSATYGDTLTLGKVFTVIDGMTIGENVTATVNGVAITVGTNWADTVLNLNAGEAEITITDNDRCWTATNTVVIEKANPSYAAPTGLTAIYGQTLADVELPTGFAWDSPGAVGNAGENTFYVTYTPDDTDNYNVVTGIEVIVAVSKAASSVTAPTAKELTYTGNAQALVNEGQATGGKLVYKLGDGEYSETIPTATNAGTYTVYYKVVGDENHNDSEIGTVEVTIAKAASSVTAPTAKELTYTGEAKALITAGTASGGTLVYSLDNVTFAKTIPTETNAGKYTVYYKVVGDENHNDSEIGTVEVTIAQATPIVTAPTGRTATVGQTLADVDLPDGFAWKNDSEALDEAGTLKFIAVYTPEDANYKSVEVEVEVEVAAKAEPTEKFVQKMPKVEFTYRLGNGNTVAMGSIFAAIEGAEIDSASVTATVTAVDGVGVSGTFAPNTSDWTKGTLQFSGTGVVKVTISATDAIPCELTFEIVNAKNATSAASATANNVVLLNDCDLDTLTVSNGYTLFGNGFTLTRTTDLAYYNVGMGFVMVNNGMLDNVRIICPNYPLSVLYGSQAKLDEYVDSSGSNWYNIYNAVTMDGNSTIANSYISGGRVAVHIRSGRAVVENTTLHGGAAANIQVGTAQSVVLRDITLIQKPITATVHNTEKTVMGFGVLVTADGASGDTTPITLEGMFNQFAWACEEYKDYIPQDYQSVVPMVMKQTDYVHDITVYNTATDWVSLGIAYLPENVGDKINAPSIDDSKLTNTSEVFGLANFTFLGSNVYVYSQKNTNTAGSVLTEPKYQVPNINEVSQPVVKYTDSTSGVTAKYAYDADYGWTSSVTVDLDSTGGTYTFDFANLIVSKYGKPLSYTVTDASGATVEKAPVSIAESGVREYTLTITDNVDRNGEAIYTHHLTLTSTKTSIPEPVLETNTKGDALQVVKSKNDDWSIAVPALTNTTVKYWDKTQGKEVSLDLSTLTPTTSGKQNKTENWWQYTDGDGDFTLKVTSGYIHDTKQVYGMPVVVNNTLYFTISSTNGYVSQSTTSRTVTLTYEFVDSNGKTLTFSKTWSVTFSSSAKQYSYSDFCNGTLKEASSGGCVTPETLVTLADGTQKQIQHLTYEDQLLVWNFTTGEYAVKPASAIVNHGADNYDVLHLQFSDGSEVKVIDKHGFFDMDVNKFVFIDEKNVDSYVGHTFAKQGAGTYGTAELVGYYVSNEFTEAYSILSHEYDNVFVEGMLSITPLPGIDNEAFYGCLVVGDNMKYDQEAIGAYIEKHGLYTYEELEPYGVTYTQYVGANLAYLKIMVGEGIVSLEEIMAILTEYVPQ